MTTVYNAGGLNRLIQNDKALSDKLYKKLNKSSYSIHDFAKQMNLIEYLNLRMQLAQALINNHKDEIMAAKVKLETNLFLLSEINDRRLVDTLKKNSNNLLSFAEQQYSLDDVLTHMNRESIANNINAFQKIHADYAELATQFILNKHIHLKDYVIIKKNLIT